MSGREDDATEVSWEDQQKINLFGRLSIRRDQLENKLSALKEQADNLEDASTDCELLEDHDRLYMRVGEVFVKRSQDEVVAEAEARLERVKKEMESDSREKAAIEAQLASLKAALYSKFGNNINLETK